MNHEQRWNALTWNDDMSDRREGIDMNTVYDAEDNADDTLAERGLPGRGEAQFASETWYEIAYDTYKYLNDRI